MLFNSFQFLFFFILVYFLYRVLDHKGQNRMLLVASYIFYGTWNWRFLGLIWLTTVLDYFCGRWIEASDAHPVRRKQILWFSVSTNLIVLGLFKYFNFFASNFQHLAALVGWQVDPVTLQVILPVGISFYTFQSMSYVIDVYRREHRAALSLRDFALYVAFFPHMIAGPIQRATNLLVQISRERRVNPEQSHEGCWLVFWGLFKKVFVADNLARIVSGIFSQDFHTLSGASALTGVYAFAFQIYGDFSGYSDMARGLAKLMGFELVVNFKHPYFVTNPRDFWRNWHISLSNWLRDYLYIPLGGNRLGEFRMYVNLFLTMLLGGLWHGAAWTFVFWGAYQGMTLILHRWVEPALRKIRFENPISKILWFAVRVIFMFHVTCLGWLFFRSPSLAQAGGMLGSILFNWRPFDPQAVETVIRIFQITWLLLVVEVFQKVKDDLLIVFHWPVWVKAPLYATLFYCILLYGTSAQEFIYFQF